MHMNFLIIYWIHVQIFFLVGEFHYWRFCFEVLFVLAEKKEEKERHDKQRNKSSNLTSISYHTQSNGDGQYNRIPMNININGDNASASSLMEDTWIHELFQGTLVSTTKCLNCETV